MRPRAYLRALIAGILFGEQTSAHSATRETPLSALSPVQNATIHTHNGRITALSRFDLTFVMYDDVQVKLQLEPNHDILAEDATISYLGPDGTITSAEKIDRFDHKIFLGTAWIRPASGDRWTSVGWARISVTQDGRDPIFEGAFAVADYEVPRKDQKLYSDYNRHTRASSRHDQYHIQTASHYSHTKLSQDPVVASAEGAQDHMVLWRESDIFDPESNGARQDLRRDVDGDSLSCPSDRLLFNTQPDHPVYLGMKKRSDSLLGSMDYSNLFSKRQLDSTTGGNSAGVNLASTIGQTAGCPSTRKVALVGVATDCTYTASFNSSQTARQNALAQMNQASAIWESTFNISLGVQNIIVSDASCPGSPAQATMWNQACSDSVDIQDRLNYFSAWRGTQRDNNSHWTLMSTCNTGSAVGLAWLGQACVTTAFTANSSSTGNGASSGGETVSGANVIVRTQGASEWQIIAHETGHTYGAVHDCYSGTCANANAVNAQQCCPLSSSVCDAGEKYIMNPSTAQGISKFSACSIGNICSALGRSSVNSTCLTNNRQVTTVNEPKCGNGIVEQGEDCDCGGTEGCAGDTCCDPTTCKFTTGSVCDDANEDCCRNCQLATNGTVCRASTGVCDPAETCSGTSPYCPADVTTPDGDSCGNGLQCASGHCTSRDQQCKTVMGSYASGNDTYACDSSSCTISCASPQFGYGVCYGLQQNFLDGTVCGGGGRCSNGRCQGSTVGGEIKSWIENNKGIVIGICAAIGGLLLLSLLGCIVRSCRRRRLRKSVPRQPRLPQPPPPGWTGGWQAQHPPMPQWNPDRPPQWSNHGPGQYPQMPPIPAPTYPPRGPSSRYA